MQISYDERKRQEVLSRRGLDLADAAELFEGFHLTRRDDRADYGEERFISVGEAGGKVVLVVWTMRKPARRIITMWKLSHDESEEFYRRRAGFDQARS